MYFTIAVIVLIFIVIFQIAKASEYVGILKGEEKSRKQTNKINGFLMFAFMIFGLIGVYYCHEILIGRVLKDSASIEGERVDDMLYLTTIICGFVFFLTQIALFYFGFKYQEKENKKAFYFPHNTTMEVVWTVIPAIVLCALVVIGLRSWFLFTGDAPKNALVVEVTGKQFGWIFRYPGKDNEFGRKYFRNIDDATNALGIIWEDNAKMNQKADPAAYDDVVQQQTVYIIKGRPVKMIINSRDVIHDVGLPHFRMKMDAVPGTPTTLWFTPKYTTAEMKEKSGNTNFQFEMSCDQMCGNGHYSMKGVVEVITQAEWDKWMSEQKTAYSSAFPEKTPAASADSTQTASTATKVVNANGKKLK